MITTGCAIVITVVGDLLDMALVGDNNRIQKTSFDRWLGMARVSRLRVTRIIRSVGVSGENMNRKETLRCENFFTD